jgi:uncharacterized membrane protein YeaQ/YmgE (transglycosylase-associated protein family)
MATCPRCLGALTDNHKCPRGIFSRLAQGVPTVLAGAVVGVVFVYALEEQPVTAVVLAAAVLGAVLAIAVRQAIGDRL